MNKKADFSSTLLWMIAAFILFFVLFIFFFYVVGIGGIKTINKDEIVKSGYDSSNDIVLLESFHSFLNSQIEYNGKLIFVKDLIINEPESDKDKYQEFKKLANEFMENYVMKVSETGGDRPSLGSVRTAWLRIYGFDETIKEYSSIQSGIRVNYDRYYDYEIRRQKIETPCRPFTPEANMFYYIIPKNKRIILCLEYEK
jgi:hypothetical protein